MGRRTRSLFSGGLTAAALLLCASPSAGQERVAVLSFFGPKAAAARGAVRAVIKQQFDVVDMPEWQKAASALNATGTSPGKLARVAQELGVKAIVNGGVRRKGRSWIVSVAVRDGATGDVIGRRSTSVPAPARAGPAAGGLMRSLLSDIEGAQGAGAPPESEPEPEPVEPEPTEEPEPTVRGAVSADELASARSDEEARPAVEDDDRSRRRRERREQRRRRREQRRRARAEADTAASTDEEPRAQEAEDSEEEAEDSEEERRSDGDEESSPQRDEEGRRGSVLSRASPHGWLELGLEVNVAQRNFTVPIDPACDGLEQRSLAGVDTGFYAEVGAMLSFYPMAIFSDARWAHLGLDFSYRHHILLTMTNTWMDEPTEVDIEIYTLGTGLTYRVPIISGERVFTVLPRIGWGRQSFFLGSEGNDMVPPIVYDHVALGVSASLDLLPRYLALEVGTHYLAVHSIGEEAVAAYNGSGQTPSSHGVLATAGLSGTIVAGLRWRFGFEFVGFFTNHEGKGRGYGTDPTTLCEGSCRDFPTCYNTEGETPVPIQGGIRTTDTAQDLNYRLVFQLSYRFGRFGGEDSGGADGPESEDREEESSQGEDWAGDDDDTREDDAEEENNRETWSW